VRGLAQEGLVERGPDKIGVGSGGSEILFQIGDAAFEIEGFVGLFDYRIADAPSQVRLQREALREVVIERGLHEAVEVFPAEVFVALGVEVEDFGLNGGLIRLDLITVGRAEIDQGAVARVEPVFLRNGADECNAA